METPEKQTIEGRGIINLALLSENRTRKFYFYDWYLELFL